MDSGVFNYDSAPQSDSVVIVAAGPSSAICKSRIIQYVGDNNSLVFAANYNYGDIKSDFTYFTDVKILKKQINKIDKNNRLVFRRWMYCNNKAYVKSIINQWGRECYQVGNRNGESIYRCGKINIQKDGSFKYYTLGGAGFGAILVSLMCRPKRIMFVGIDGPLPGQVTKKTFDGNIIRSDGPKKDIKITNYFKEILFPSLKRFGIIVETYEETQIYGLNKKKLGVSIIE